MNFSAGIILVCILGAAAVLEYSVFKYIEKKNNKKQ